MADICRLTMTGRLKADPEKVGNEEKPICVFTLACNVVTQGQPDTVWIDCAVAGAKAGWILGNKYMVKGRGMVVSGNLRQRNYRTKDGSKRTSYTLWLTDMPELMPQLKKVKAPGDKDIEFPDEFGDPDIPEVEF